MTNDLDIGASLLYKWRQKYTPTGEKSCYATLKEGLKALKLENAQFKKGQRLLCESP